MKLGSIRVAVLSVTVLASPWLTFAGGQPAKVKMLSKSEMQSREGMTRAINQGKGGVLTRNDNVLRGNAYRSQTAQDSQALKDNSGSPHPNWNDSGFHK